jgi:hypothetical protein
VREREEGKKGMKKVGRKRKVRLELRWMRSVLSRARLSPTALPLRPSACAILAIGQIASKGKLPYWCVTSRDPTRTRHVGLGGCFVLCQLDP